MARDHHVIPRMMTRAVLFALLGLLALTWVATGVAVVVASVLAWSTVLP